MEVARAFERGDVSSLSAAVDERYADPLGDARSLRADLERLVRAFSERRMHLTELSTTVGSRGDVVTGRMELELVGSSTSGPRSYRVLGPARVEVSRSRPALVGGFLVELRDVDLMFQGELESLRPIDRARVEWFLGDERRVALDVWTQNGVRRFTLLRVAGRLRVERESGRR
ncbi:MAG: hypothetical protein HYV07_13910 [Deltaproteobacteria bacterium]|nr:hypothetical protein [Deltaproteobacteria bacterium]